MKSLFTANSPKRRLPDVSRFLKKPLFQGLFFDLTKLPDDRHFTLWPSQLHLTTNIHNRNIYKDRYAQHD